MSLLKKLALISSLALAGCVSGPFAEEARSSGSARFVGGNATFQGFKKTLEIYCGNDINYIPEKGFDVDGQKDLFVNGEPIKVGLYLSGDIERGLENGSVGITKLLRNGEVDISKTKRTNSGNYIVIDYGQNLGVGNYTVIHHGGEAFMGSIDFQVVSPSGNVASGKK